MTTILMDLDCAEESLYMEVFLGLAPSGHAEPDNRQLREFVMNNSAVTIEEVDTEILKIASESESFSVDTRGFLRLLQDNAISESDALNQFVGLTSDGECITSEDCRTGLLNLMEQRLGATLNDEQSEQIFNTVMMEAGLTVPMEQWFNFSKKAARIVRLMRYAKAM
jgi:hypothetical protein